VAPGGADPAIALIEFDSIAVGIVAADAMVKSSPLGSIYAGTVHPGKYLVLVSGDTASVEEALGTGLEVGRPRIVDHVFLPDVHPAVTVAVAGRGHTAPVDGDALGIVETATVATVIDAADAGVADAGVKAAQVDLAAVRLADGLGGKGYALFCGAVAEVEAAVERAVDRALPTGMLLHHRIIPQLHGEVADNLRRDLRFMTRVGSRPAERGG
jgi:microcompartment protein CcmL/EutN